jgi:hypothetical protein
MFRLRYQLAFVVSVENYEDSQDNHAEKSLESLSLVLSSDFS